MNIPNTIQECQEIIAKHRADNIRRLDLDVSDCALSSWASDSIISSMHIAEEALKLGAEYGIDGPACIRRVLCRGDVVVSTREIPSKFYNGKPSWLLSDPIDGRRFVPTRSYRTGNSRVQDELGLTERDALFVAQRKLGSACAGLGLPVVYFAEPVKDSAPVKLI